MPIRSNAGSGIIKGGGNVKKIKVNKRANDLSGSKKSVILYSLIVGSGLIISGIILQNYDSVIRFKSYQRSLSVILLTIVGCCIYEEKFTMNMFLGILLILFGMYLLDK